MTARNLAYIAASVLVLVGLAMLLLGAIRPSTCPPGMVCLDPAKMSCFVFDMGAAGWRPVDKDERHYISARVMDRKALYKFQAHGVDCYQRDENFLLGEKIASFPVEWWKPSK